MKWLAAIVIAIGLMEIIACVFLLRERWHHLRGSGAIGGIVWGCLCVGLGVGVFRRNKA